MTCPMVPHTSLGEVIVMELLATGDEAKALRDRKESCEQTASSFWGVLELRGVQGRSMVAFAKDGLWFLQAC